MPSFVRRAKPSDPTGLKDGTEKNVVPRGAYPCLTASDPPLYLISGGIPSLDDVLGEPRLLLLLSGLAERGEPM